MNQIELDSGLHGICNGDVDIGKLDASDNVMMVCATLHGHGVIVGGDGCFGDGDASAENGPHYVLQGDETNRCNGRCEDYDGQCDEGPEVFCS